MAEGLVSALQDLHLKLQSLEGNLDGDDAWIDTVLDEQRPPKRIKQDHEELERELEQKYLAPSTTFSTKWLNKLQQ